MKPLSIHGFVQPGFEAVREAFADNFRHRHELGGACCIYRHGEKVVDLWGGVRNRFTEEPWEENTMVIVFSTTKGMAAMTLALAHSRGWLDYEERVSAYWPEFAQNGKEAITVRQLLAHQAGLHAISDPVDPDLLRDQDRLAAVLARQRPEWAPGSRQAYHAISLGFYEGEIIRRVDPKHRSLGRFFQEEIADPLELDFYIRLPETVPNTRLATPEMASLLSSMAHMPLPMLMSAINPHSELYRALIVNPGPLVCLDKERVYAREMEVPSGGGVGTARAIARAYSAFLSEELGLNSETLSELRADARPSEHGFFDEALRGEIQFSLGFMKPCPNWEFGHPGAFGSPGAGGSLGYADPATGIAYAFVTNRMGSTITVDPRDLALRQALDASLGASPRTALR